MTQIEIAAELLDKTGWSEQRDRLLVSVLVVPADE
jgi:hypothetical protein